MSDEKATLSTLPIKDDAEFNAVMEELDHLCQQRGEQIIGRELKLWTEFCKKYQIAIVMKVSTAHPARPNEYTFFNFGNHIIEWAKNRYGARLTFDPAFGYFATLLRGDAWLVAVPMIMGKVTLTVTTDIERAHAPHVVNLLQLVKGLTPEMARSLAMAETEYVKGMFLVHFDIHNLRIRANLSPDSLAAIASRDLTSCAKRVVLDRHERGAARFDALQAADKFLKHFLRTKGQSFRRTHDLEWLSKKTAEAGLLGNFGNLIAAVQTSGGSRYGEMQHTVQDVVRALDAAAFIGRNVMVQLYATSTNTSAVSLSVHYRD